MISDFGLSKMEGKGDVMSTACGTPGYVGKSFDYLLVKIIFWCCYVVHMRFYRYLLDFSICLCSALCSLPFWGAILHSSSGFVGFTCIFSVLCRMSVLKDTAYSYTRSI